MKCPHCGFEDSKVIDSRPVEDGSVIRRRRECQNCQERFTTYERLEEIPLIVLKSDNSSQVYNRQKLLKGICIACAKRPISPDTIEKLVDDIESELRTIGVNEISSKSLGNMVLKRLANVDDVAYVRFASVYREFDDISEFRKVLEEIQL